MFLFRLFAHKKGVGSSKNGRDSAAKRLGPKRSDGHKDRRLDHAMRRSQSSDPRARLLANLQNFILKLTAHRFPF